jgi:hypothetical protein
MKVSIIEKAFFRRCPLDERKKFKQSKCFMPISIGQKIHEGIKLQATLALVNRTFKGCVILIDDIIQRHTMQIENKNVSLEELSKVSEEEGDSWIKRNTSLLEALDIPYKIIRWRKWLFHPDFPPKKLTITRLYQEDAEFKRSMDEGITNFLDRYKKRNDDLSCFDEAHAFTCCLNYLIEECACMCLWPEEQCEYELYPSGRNPAMIATYEKLIKPEHPGLMVSVALYFKKSGREVIA